MLKTKYWANHISIEIQELALGFEIPDEPPHIVLTDKREPDTLTRIIIDDYFSVYVFWVSDCEFSNTFSTLIIPEEYCLFIGAGSISAQFNLNGSILIKQREVNEFEYFIRYDNCVIECCYGECTAFDLKGNILNHHELAMMWEIEHKENAFHTNCHDNGLRKLVVLNT